MANETKISPKYLVLYSLLVLVVAFIGVVAGNWFVEWRRGRAHVPPLEDWVSHNPSLLEMGKPFPNEAVINLQGGVDSTRTLMAGSKTVILFVASGCEPCARAVEMWKNEADELPADLRVIGIAAGDTAEVAKYKSETGFPYPIYCDAQYLFAQQYDLRSFPSMVVVDGDGNVAFVLAGFRDGFHIQDAYDLLSEPRT